jgi:hypothetical protein
MVAKRNTAGARKNDEVTVTKEAASGLRKTDFEKAGDFRTDDITVTPVNKRSGAYRGGDPSQNYPQIPRTRD